MTATGALPRRPLLTCEWVRPDGRPCGTVPATWALTMHDPESPDPDAIRVFLVCPGCAMSVLRWAQREHAAGAGTYCRGCNTLLTPTLGAFLLGHAELDDPESDVRYDQP